jgi:DNA polymerase-1
VEKIRNILEDDGIAKVGWNMKRDYKFFKQKGIKLGGLYFDVLLGYYLLHSGEKIDIESVVFEELEEEFQEEEKGQISLDSFSSKKKGEKLCQKVDYIWKLKEIVSEKIEKISEKQNKARVNSLSSLFYEVEMPLVEILAEIEENGVRVNEIILKGVNEKIEKRIENLEREIQDMAGEELNINSPNQLQKILFEKMNIPTEGIKKTKTGYSTAASELNKIRGEHKIIKKIEEYREIFKLKTTYLDNLYELAKKGKRIHSTFNQAVTSTGRLSSENPNLQNIPIRTELGKVIRTAFEAKEGNLLISADYSQIDLRVMAHMSGDKKMTEAFWEGADIHTKTAAQVNDVTHSKVTQKMRSQAKALNFGVIYGMGSFGFSQSAKIEVKEAKEFISAYMKEFSGVADFIRKTKEEAKEKGYVETELGRRRYLPEINSPNFQVQAGAERMAVNMPIQGLAADIMKLAMIKVYEKYKKNNFVKMILQVHDEIILEVREKDAEKISKEMKEIMENVYKLKVPLVVDTKTGLNWGEL